MELLDLSKEDYGYLVKGLRPWTKADEKKLDALVPENFAGNVTEHLRKQGYILDEQQLILASPGGMRICRFCDAA